MSLRQVYLLMISAVGRLAARSILCFCNGRTSAKLLYWCARPITKSATLVVSPGKPVDKVSDLPTGQTNIPSCPLYSNNERTAQLTFLIPP